jgi:hypothetical protein
MMTTGTNVLDDILESKDIVKRKFTSFDYRALNKKQRSRSSAYAHKITEW